MTSSATEKHNKTKEASTADSLSFQRYWTLEAIRLRETEHGPLDDSGFIFDLLNSDASVEEKITRRAEQLAEQSPLANHIKQYNTLLKVAQRLLCVIAVLLGLSAAYVALGSRGGQVNLSTAWIALLGPHILALVLWLVLSTISGKSDTLLGRLWLGLSHKLARRDDRSLAANALLHVLEKSRLLSPMLARTSHLFWTCLMAGTLVGLLFLLATRSYHFVWATTILPADGFDKIAYALGFLPSWVGFPNPDSLPVIDSPNTTVNANQFAQNGLWSAWLIGQVLFYGFIVRLALTLLFGLFIRSRMKDLRPDFNLPGLAALRDRLSRYAEPVGIDSPAPEHTMDNSPVTRPESGQGYAIAGIELSEPSQWPPFTLSDKVDDLGNIDDRQQRHRFNQYLSRHKPLSHILLVCDARITPDRGHLNYIRQIMQSSADISIYLINAESDRPERTQQWQDKLTGLGIDASAIYLDPEELEQWPA